MDDTNETTQPLLIDEVIGHLSVLKLELGDTIVFLTDQRLSNEAAVRTHQKLEQLFPAHKCLVIEEGARLGVVREHSAVTEPETTERLTRKQEELLVYDVPEAGRLLGIGRSASYDAARTGDLPTIRIRSRLKVPKLALQKLLESAGQEA